MYMENLYKRLVCFTALLVGTGGAFTGCGGYTQQSSTTTSVTLAGSSAAAANAKLQLNSSSPKATRRTGLMQGGIMVYFQGINGNTLQSGVFLHDENDMTTFTLPNGTYQLFSIGYASAGFAGVMYCGYNTPRTPISLNGNPQIINVELDSSAPCMTDPSFGIGTLIVQKCSNSDFTAYGGSLNYSIYPGTCVQGTPTPGIASATVSLNTYSAPGGVTDPNSVAIAPTLTTCLDLPGPYFVSSTTLPSFPTGGTVTTVGTTGTGIVAGGPLRILSSVQLNSVGCAAMSTATVAQLSTYWVENLLFKNNFSVPGFIPIYNSNSGQVNNNNPQSLFFQNPGFAQFKLFLFL